MTDKEINLAIAASVGIPPKVTYWQYETGGMFSMPVRGFKTKEAAREDREMRYSDRGIEYDPVGDIEPYETDEHLIDYLKNREAMISVLKTLNEFQHSTFLAELSYLLGYPTVNPCNDKFDTMVFDSITAPLELWAKAYLIVINKWTDGP